MSDILQRFTGAKPRTVAPASRDSFRRTWPWWLVVLIAAVLFPLLQNNNYIYFMAGLVGVYSLVGIGMNLLYGLGGQVSLGQGAIVAVGAYLSGVLIVDHQWGMWATLATATVAGAVTGIVMGLPALRLSTWYFALTTLAFAQLTIGLIEYFSDLTGGNNGLIGIIVPLTTPQLYWLIVAANMIGLLIYWTFANSRLGRGLLAVKEGAEAGTGSGVSTAYMKLITFGLSGAYTGAAGALFAFEQQVIAPDQFTVIFSIFFIVIVVAGGLGRLLGPVIGALAFFAVPEFLTSLSEWRMVIYGAALLLCMAFAPHGILGAAEAIWDKFRGKAKSGKAAGEQPGEEGADRRTEQLTDLLSSRARSAGDGSPEMLVVRDAELAFGGIKALQGVSMTLERGKIYGLVGPNGSGKTTLLNVITGIYVPQGGTVSLNGGELVGTAPSKVVKRGIARTFQTPRLLGDLSVWENVMLGAYTKERATAFEVLFRLPRNRREARKLGHRANELLDALGLGHRAGDRASDLPHGHQRLVEIARALMTEPALLLLDEPAAGMSSDELEVLDRLVRAVGKAGVTVLVVEHHISWVREVCEHVTVLDQGRVITSGEPEAVFAHPRVRETYLGVVV